MFRKLYHASAIKFANRYPDLLYVKDSVIYDNEHVKTQDPDLFAFLDWLRVIQGLYPDTPFRLYRILSHIFYFYIKNHVLIEVSLCCGWRPRSTVLVEWYTCPEEIMSFNISRDYTKSTCPFMYEEMVMTSSDSIRRDMYWNSEVGAGAFPLHDPL